MAPTRVFLLVSKVSPFDTCADLRNEHQSTVTIAGGTWMFVYTSVRSAGTAAVRGGREGLGRETRERAREGANACAE